MDWAAGLATRKSARRAAKWGGRALLLVAALDILRSFAATWVLVRLGVRPFDSPIAWTIGVAIPPLIFAVGGFRMMRGEGRWEGSIAVLLLALDIGLTAARSSEISTLLAIFALRGTLLALAINGLRGAFALHSRKMDAELEATFS